MLTFYFTTYANNKYQTVLTHNVNKKYLQQMLTTNANKTSYKKILTKSVDNKW